jgi:hypothetical protein
MASTEDHLASLKQVTDAIDLALRTLGLAMQATEALRMDLQHGLEAGIERPVQDGIASLPLPAVPVSEHRRGHRPGRPPIIATDPALQAFIAARLDRMSFEEIAADVTRHFPKERRVGKSAIHAWYQSNRKGARRNAGRGPDHSG